MTCSVTGTIRIATVAAISRLSTRWVPSRSFFKLFRVVDRGEDLLGADFLRVRLHHGIHELLHLRAVREGDALQLAGLFQRYQFRRVFGGLDLAPIGARLLARAQDRRAQVGRQAAECLPGKADRPDRDRVLGHGEVGADFVELHRLNARRLVLARRDDAVLDGVVHLVVRDHRGRHADRGEGAAPDRSALHAHLEVLHLGEVAHRLVDEDVAGAAPGVADQHDVGLLRDLVRDRLEQIGIEHLVPVVEVAEDERRVYERRRLREGGHMRRRHDPVVHALALVHVGEVVLLQPELAVLVEHESDRLAVVLLHQLLELEQRLVEGVVVVELHRAVQRDGLRDRARREARRHGSGRPSQNLSAYHACLLVSLMVMRHRVRASCGSVSVAEWSSDALSQITTSPTPYSRRSWYFSSVAWRLSSSSRARASPSGMPSMPNELPETAYSAVRPVTGWRRATGCLTQRSLAFCSSVSSEAAVRELSSRSSRLP